MKVIFNADGTGHGVSCAVEEGQYALDVSPALMRNGFKGELYKDVDGVVVALSSSEVAATVARKNFKAKVSKIEAKRYEMEVADLDYGGLLIKQDRESRNLLDMTMNKIRRGLVEEIEWHCKNGYLILSVENIAEIELLGLQQIQNAFMWAKAEIAKLEE
jgi:hypothetical protein